jgi:hypothetical protein
MGMNAPNNQELQIIQALSSVSVPEKVIRESNIKELIHGMTADQELVQTDAQRLEQLRQEEKDGNFIGNWYYDRDDKVQDAQIDLNKSIGRLTQKSSQLLIVNTAISKVLNDQQHILLEQQNILKYQTDALEEQNFKILEQQELLERQQQDINKANQGLLEAKSLTQEQAHKLVGCVVRVTEAEKKIDTANEALRTALEQHVHDSVAQCIASLKDGFAKQTQRQDAFEQQLEGSFAVQSQHTQAELGRFASDATEFKTNVEKQLQAHVQTVLEKTSTQNAATQKLHETLSAQLKKLQQDTAVTMEQKVLALCETVRGVEQGQETALQVHAQALEAQRESLERSLQHLGVDLRNKSEALKDTEGQLAILQAKQQKSASRNRLALAAVAFLALASLGWQIAQHFALV